MDSEVYTNTGVQRNSGTGVITQVRKVKDPLPVEGYLRIQKRFKNLFTMEGGEEIKKIQAMADWNIKHYGLQ